MLYATAAIELAREYMESGSGSYRQLASYLNRIYPRIDGPWTKDATYHMCRLNGISSKRPCKSQPRASNTQRSNTRQSIINATLDALTTTGRTILDIAPVHLKDVVTLSGAPLCNVRSNWHKLEDELNALAGLPPKPTSLIINED